MPVYRVFRFFYACTTFPAVAQGIANTMNNRNVLETVAQERPVGTSTNTSLLIYLENEIRSAGYEIDSLPFNCIVWEHGRSSIRINEQDFDVTASPFSAAYDGVAETVTIRTVEDLRHQDCRGKIVLMCGDIAQAPLQPKAYPFYFPDEHKAIISLLEDNRPAAILAFTGRSHMCGLSPFPMFEDGNFRIPSAYLSERHIPEIPLFGDNGISARLTIDSHNSTANSAQLVAYRESDRPKGKIVLCAHMDSKYGTPGALDNAAGVAVLLRAMWLLKDASLDYDLDIAPFNGEEYFGATGEVRYLDYITERRDNVVLSVNIDSPCHAGSQVAISTYNADAQVNSVLGRQLDKWDGITSGDAWYAGDHMIFAQRGIPCIALASSDLYTGGLECTHTPGDTLESVDLKQIETAAAFLAEFILDYQTA